VDATPLVPGQAANFAASLPATTNSPFMSRAVFLAHSPFRSKSHAPTAWH